MLRPSFNMLAQPKRLPRLLLSHLSCSSRPVPSCESPSAIKRNVVYKYNIRINHAQSVGETVSEMLPR